MALFNSTRVYLNTKRSRGSKTSSIYRVPVPQVNESFFFNQDAIKVIVYDYTNNAISYKESSMASIHLTNKRLILLSQSTSIASTMLNHFDTCEFQLSDFQSLKTHLIQKKGLRFDIKTLQGLDIRIDITFLNKKDAHRRESLKEYVKMATSAILARGRSSAIPTYTHDDLPSYLEATTNSSVAPPAYS